MLHIIIIGNSGSGKSTLAKKFKNECNCVHLDLDTLAWQDTIPPERRAVENSEKEIKDFLNTNTNWVIEGGYTDLIELVLDSRCILIYLNPGVDTCIENCKNRPWEPHKYASIELQNENLNMLLDWVFDYESRDDAFSKSAHGNMFNAFNGFKYEFFSNSESEDALLGLKGT